MTWTSSDTAVVRVKPTSTGATLVAADTGSAMVTASVDGVSGTVTASVLAFASITAGPVFSCALTSAGELFCVGGPYGVAGAVRVAPTLRFTTMSLGENAPDEEEACAVAKDQTAYCWSGKNDFGQLGVGDKAAHTEPTPVGGGHHFASVSVGDSHACGVTVEQVAYCWGNGSEGRLGTGDTLARLEPAEVQFARPMTVTQIDAGANGTCAVATPAPAYCWGRDDLGQLGSSLVAAGQIGEFSLRPVPVDSGDDTRQIVTKGPHTGRLSAAGFAYCFGGNTVGELGSRTTETCYGRHPCSTVRSG